MILETQTGPMFKIHTSLVHFLPTVSIMLTQRSSSHSQHQIKRLHINTECNHSWKHLNSFLLNSLSVLKARFFGWNDYTEPHRGDGDVHALWKAEKPSRANILKGLLAIWEAKEINSVCDQNKKGGRKSSFTMEERGETSRTDFMFMHRFTSIYDVYIQT